MRNTIIGIVIGTVLGVVIGATILAPRLATGPATESLAGDENRLPAAPSRLETAAGGPSVQWRMASAFAGSLPQIGTLAKRLEKELWRVSGGSLDVRFHEPDTLVPTNELFDAVSSGAIDAAFSSPGFWKDKAPALQLFAAVPFGPSPSEYLAWVYFGGGRELFQEIYRRYNIESVFCGLMAPEASGWFRKRIRTVEELRGLRMRFLGLGARVMEKLGVETRSLADGDTFMALESGAVDAAENSTPAIDLKLGFQEVAKHYYFPGWHQSSTFLDLMINRDKWEALSATARAQIEAVCGDNIRYGLAEGEAAQFAALKALTAQGVQIHRWPPEIMEALKKAWQEVATEEAAADPDFRRVWESLTAFRRDYGIWSQLGQL